MTEASFDLGTGRLTAGELLMLFKSMPVSIDLMDDANSLLFYSTSDAERAARRKKTLGKNVMDCHSPESKVIIEKMVAEFKAGRNEPFAFFRAGEDAQTRTRYFPVRDEAGTYRGILEVSDDITDIYTGGAKPGRISKEQKWKKKG